MFVFFRIYFLCVSVFSKVSMVRISSSNSGFVIGEFVILS